MPRSVRPRTERLRTGALLVRRVPFGEADLLVGLFTEQGGLISATARGARRSAKRFPALEPMHLLRVTLEIRPGAELAQLTEAAIERPRLRLAGDLGRLEVAGRALRWVREIAPAHTAEQAAWRELNQLLDRLDEVSTAPPQALLAETGLRLLVAFGWGLELTQCVRCGRPCDTTQSACADPARGGLVCRACGGGPVVLRPEPRERLYEPLLGGAPIPEKVVPTRWNHLEGALTAHASGG